MYKDKDKQREANKKAKARQRAKLCTEMITNDIADELGMTQGMTLADNVIPLNDIRVIPKQGQDIKCYSDQDFTKLLVTLPSGSPTYRVSKPGDEDYVPMCETTRRYIEDEGRTEVRGV